MCIRDSVDSEEAALQIVTKLQHAFEPPLDIDGEPLAVRALSLIHI